MGRKLCEFMSLQRQYGTEIAIAIEYQSSALIVANCFYRSGFIRLREQYGTEIVIAIEYQSLC
ncbi:hypothetical protein [Brochothrix thermosphacta]|uniref:hypothetical protein n=1 Tax=Brochothrix thermosphacta TaxID=2756 RepID=UPI000D7A7703|nr:hypothetical protein [Brochothrix thermosphacta]SPN76470.1 hypothetical protein BTEBP_70087 [Brochothrix thermosphacta]